jgi:hypothetical protein
MASGVAKFWLRTSIKTQEQLMGLLGEQTNETEPPARAPQNNAEPTNTEALSSKMRELLERALDNSTSSSQMELFHHILDQWVADDWTRRRVQGRAVLENASLVGRTANVALPDMVPSYVSHLLSLGLVEVGPEDPDLKDDYEILMAESSVLQAIKTASRGPLAAKVDKFTLSLSGLGHALWAATMQQDGP